ncbi:hypothetical protein IU450_30255 [Nocardia abscessus]|uniref:hypothetical protein n=1 Tax=Nocardia abscessus TaxID=120957 RepID=UPI0018962ECA|nr:hypothetical protein [Nocardia abscessus]MBF6340139.1 hypothetical protein [Nocardia abscessus]
MDWARSVLHAGDIEVTGAAVETKRRAWSLLARIPTDAGPMWVKANARAFAHEGPLVLRLARLRPGSVLEPLAVRGPRLATQSGRWRHLCSTSCAGASADYSQRNRWVRAGR